MRKRIEKIMMDKGVDYRKLMMETGHSMTVLKGTIAGKRTGARVRADIARALGYVAADLFRDEQMDIC